VKNPRRPAGRRCSFRPLPLATSASIHVLGRHRRTGHQAAARAANDGVGRGRSKKFRRASYSRSRQTFGPKHRRPHRLHGAFCSGHYEQGQKMRPLPRLGKYVAHRRSLTFFSSERRNARRRALGRANIIGLTTTAHPDRGHFHRRRRTELYRHSRKLRAGTVPRVAPERPAKKSKATASGPAGAGRGKAADPGVFPEASKQHSIPRCGRALLRVRRRRQSPERGIQGRKCGLRGVNVWSRAGSSASDEKKLKEFTDKV